ncbi:DNA topoisomerase [Chlamydoabsidia padenii]|nr:DNA topoisomerase [Chlamydoabsidia padenii]
MRVLCVAEKPKAAKHIAEILSQSSFRTESTSNTFVKNYIFDYTVNQRTASFVMTSVLGHLTDLDFPPSHKSWQYSNPADLFCLETVEFVNDDMKTVAANLRQQVRAADILFIWTDCDREGEGIGGEVVQECRKVKPNIQVWRAHFSAMQPGPIHSAAQNPQTLDERTVQAVMARRELDLRTGAAFTRLQTLNLRSCIGGGESMVISYGSCQFPTLGFVVEQYLSRENFVSEDFWKINLTYTETRPNEPPLHTSFNWDRVRCFDRHTCFVLYNQCVTNPLATVTKVTRKNVQKWRPIPLATLELQKMGTKYLRMTGDEIMTIAQGLYTEGFISYPRTETDQFDDTFQFMPLIQMQTQHPEWGQYAQGLVDGNFETPRRGRSNDKAHPPIHPTAFNSSLTGNQKKVYDFVVRRFLGCCSKNAQGDETVVNISIATETFETKGLVIKEKNYLEVYTFDVWSGRTISNFIHGQQFTPSELTMNPGRTEPPQLLTESDLIGKMEQNGIGTDATISDLIKKILLRQYAFKVSQKYFIPSTLGIALVMGYEDVGLEESLIKPKLHQMTEADLKLICQGVKTKEQVLRESVTKYQSMFSQIVWEFGKLVQAVRTYYDAEEDKRRKLGQGRFLGHQDLNSNGDNGDNGGTATRGGRGRGRGGTTSRGSNNNTARGLGRGSTTSTRARGTSSTRGRGRASTRGRGQ